MTTKPKLTTTKTANTPPLTLHECQQAFGIFFKNLPSISKEPVTELHYTSEFELLIAVMLSAQATDKSVNIATDKLFKVANTPKAILIWD